MKRRCAIKESPELEIELEDKTFTIMFSNSLFIQYEELFGDLKQAFEGGEEGITTCEFFARILYSYFQYMGEELTLTDCKVLIIKGGDGLLSSITECFLEAVTLTDNEEIKKKVVEMNREMRRAIGKK